MSRIRHRSRLVSVTLPAVYRIDERDGKNVIQQLDQIAWKGEAEITRFELGRATGLQVQRADGHPPIFAITNTAQPIARMAFALRFQAGATVDLSGKTLDLTTARWLKHPDIELLNGLKAYVQNATATRESWKNAFHPKKEDIPRSVFGLRPPQLGAIYAVQAHWTVNQDVGTIVLPTGVGKTETMLSLLVAEQSERLLVVVPTDALRTQIVDKFLTLGLLKTLEFGVIDQTARYPVVGVLNERPTKLSEVSSFLQKCNVVVTTMALASQCAPRIMERMADLCPCLFIDEAHHVAAPRWNEFRSVFRRSRIIQFTATPFRNDDRLIGGRRLFTFSLRQAQEQGYFKPINFAPVMEFDPRKKDAAIADAAVARLKEEAHLGHILMARVATVARAAEVFEHYRRYPAFNPVQLHTGIKSKAEREEIRQKILSGQSRIIVCVDMLGEGFDLPELKIAAFHDIRKSLAVTLQLAGRFTRTKPNLGNATFIANTADLDVKGELLKLYRHDADWNLLLPIISERASEADLKIAEFLRGFKDLPDELSLARVRPAMSTVAYRTKCAEWSPDRFERGIPGADKLDRLYHTVNAEENTLVVVTARRVPVEWAQLEEIHTWEWELYVLHWDATLNLLFIHHSKNAGFFKRLAEAVAGDVQLVQGQVVFRCFAGIHRLRLMHVGLREQRGRLISFTMRSGSDVEPGMSEAQKKKSIKSNLFGHGYSNGQRVSIGSSRRGRIWSHRTANLLTLVNWCGDVGQKLINERLNPDKVLAGTLIPKIVDQRPTKVPIAVDWPEIFWREIESAFTFSLDGECIPLCNASLEVVNASPQGPLLFALRSESKTATFELRLIKEGDAANYRIVPLDKVESVIAIRGRETPLVEFLDHDPPIFWFADGSQLDGNEFIEVRGDREIFPRDRLESWTWTKVDIRKESQGVTRNPKSIQYRVIQEAKKGASTVIFDDDDHGELADVVTIAETSDGVAVEFWHCKYAAKDDSGARIKELYEVCGQAQKSVRWLEKSVDMFSHLMRREPRRRKQRTFTRFERGGQADLLRIQQKAEMQRVSLTIVIVQPGLSANKASKEQLELLAATESYLKETLAVELRVVGGT